MNPVQKYHIGDTIRSGVVCLIPRQVCFWLWHESESRNIPPLGKWAPHILGRMLSRNAYRRR